MAGQTIRAKQGWQWGPTDPACGRPIARIDRARAGTKRRLSGPARIVCNAAFCEMGSGARPKERVRVIVSDLPPDEIHRLRKCTGVAKPCMVTIDGSERGAR